jgi:competence protein ComEC
MIYLDIPEGIQEIVLGYEYIPDDFGRTHALDVAFLDVGQGDCSLIGSRGQYVLIDSGENEMGNKVLRYLDQLEVDTIDVMILTHPHSDHIGGADIVIKDKEVKSVYMPDAASNTKTFEDVLDAVDESGLEIDIPDVGDVLKLDGMTIEFVHPKEGEEYDNANNVSITVRILNEYGSALFTGDIEASAEREILSTGLDIKSDVLKVSHHGSSTSTTEEFFLAADPKFAVISCGKNNEFGHPHDETMELLGEYGTDVYLTNEGGNIYFSFSSEGVSVASQNG